MNNTAKHTPGPLKAVQIIIENSPCTWAVQRKSLREQWGKPSVATYIDNEADARLFAAAPAMYEALSELVKYLREEVADEALDTWEPVFKAAMVLAQAEGRTL